MLSHIVEELVAYNPAAGAVFGVELVRFGHLSILCDDGSRPWQQMVNLDHSGQVPRIAPPNGETGRQPSQPAAGPSNLLETVRAPGGVAPPPVPAKRGTGTTQPPPIPSATKARAQTPGADCRGEASGEIQVKNKATIQGHVAAPNQTPQMMGAVPPPAAPTETAMGTPNPQRVITTPVPPSGVAPRHAPNVEVPSTDEVTQPGVDIVRGAMAGAPLVPGSSGVVGGEIDPSKKSEKKTEPEPAQKGPQEPRGSILGIGMGAIGASAAVGAASGEISQKIAPGGRVLVPGPNGLMQSATVRQLLQGYYELEVGGSGETIWVPMNGVVPE
jgi:hypothetical protein